MVCPCTTYRQQFLAVPHRLRVSVGLPMYRLSPIILGCASSSSRFSWLPMHRLSPVVLGQTPSPSRFSWFAHVPLIANNSWLCLIPSRFSWFAQCLLSPVILGQTPSSLCFSWFAQCLLSPVILGQTLAVFVFQLVCPVPLIANNSCPNQYKYSPMPYA